MSQPWVEQTASSEGHINVFSAVQEAACAGCAMKLSGLHVRLLLTWQLSRPIAKLGHWKCSCHLAKHYAESLNEAASRMYC